MTATLTRVPGWEHLLAAFVRARMATPFAWGVNDCALFAADAVAAITGVDLAADLRGYTSAHAANSLLLARGGLSEIATRALGAPVGISQVRDGDLALVMQAPRRTALGVCVSHNLVAGPGGAGLQTAPRSLALMAWRVG